MRQVEVFEVSRSVKSTELDFIEWVRWTSPPEDWTEVAPVGDDGPTYVRARAPVSRLRTADGRDILIAIGPELHDLVLPAVQGVELDRLRGEVVSLGLRIEARDEEIKDLKWWLNESMTNQEDYVNRIEDLRHANVFTRIWRAIRRDFGGAY